MALSLALCTPSGLPALPQRGAGVRALSADAPPRDRGALRSTPATGPSGQSSWYPCPHRAEDMGQEPSHRSSYFI